MESGRLEIHPEEMDVNETIDQALIAVSGQIREKNISLRLDVPKKIPHISETINSYLNRSDSSVVQRLFCDSQ